MRLGETPAGFTFDIPPEEPFEENKQAEAPAPEFGPEFENIFTQPDAEQDNFLTQARRSARAASEKAESERLGRIGNFRWGHSEENSEGQEKKRSRLVIPLVLALVTLLAAVQLVCRINVPQPVGAPPDAPPA